MASRNAIHQLDTFGGQFIADIGCSVYLMDLATDADTTICNRPAQLLGVHVLTANNAYEAHFMNTGTETIFIVPVSTAVNTQFVCYSAIFTSGIVLVSDNATTGRLQIFYRPI